MCGKQAPDGGGDASKYSAMLTVVNYSTSCYKVGRLSSSSTIKNLKLQRYSQLSAPHDIAYM